MFQLMFGFGWAENKIWGKMTKLKKWPIFPDFFKNARVVNFDSLPRDEKMVAMDQFMWKPLVEGYNLTNWKFQMKRDNWLLGLMSQYGLILAYSGMVASFFSSIFTSSPSASMFKAYYFYFWAAAPGGILSYRRQNFVRPHICVSGLPLLWAILQAPSDNGNT